MKKLFYVYCFFSTVQIFSSQSSSQFVPRSQNEESLSVVVSALERADSIALGTCDRGTQERCAKAAICIGTVRALRLAAGIYERHLDLKKQRECADRLEALGTPEALVEAGKIYRQAGGRDLVLDGSHGVGGAASGSGVASKEDRLEKE